MRPGERRRESRGGERREKEVLYALMIEPIQAEPDPGGDNCKPRKWEGHESAEF